MPVSKGVRTTAVVMTVIVVIGLIVYFVFLFEAYKNSTFIFKMVEPVPDQEMVPFYPTGVVTPLTDEEIDERKTLINALLTEVN